jgi:ABC-type amino acid transport system permease subunit
MTAKLLSLAFALAALIPSHAVVAGVAVDVRAAVAIVLLAACAGLGLAVARRVRAFRPSPAWRWV